MSTIYVLRIVEIRQNYPSSNCTLTRVNVGTFQLFLLYQIDHIWLSRQHCCVCYRLIDLHPVGINEAAEAHGTRALTDPNDP